jgi:hypothetical protein
MQKFNREEHIMIKTNQSTISANKQISLSSPTVGGFFLAALMATGMWAVPQPATAGETISASLYGLAK